MTAKVAEAEAKMAKAEANASAMEKGALHMLTVNRSRLTVLEEQEQQLKQEIEVKNMRIVELERKLERLVRSSEF